MDDKMMKPPDREQSALDELIEDYENVVRKFVIPQLAELLGAMKLRAVEECIAAARDEAAALQAENERMRGALKEIRQHFPEVSNAMINLIDVSLSHSLADGGKHA